MTERDDLPERTLSAEQARADAAELRASLDQMASLVGGTRGLEELLAQIASYAASAIPGATGAGVTVLRANGATAVVEAIASSAPFVSTIDEIQYEILNEGHCITAALERRTVRSGSLGGEQRWPRFGARVGRLGVHSVLSL